MRIADQNLLSPMIRSGVVLAQRPGFFRALLAGALLLLVVAACAVPPPFDREAVCQRSVLACAPFRMEPNAGRVSDPLLAEISGLAVTRMSNERLWAINDSGGEAALYLLDAQGTYLGKVEVTGATNNDWEELATFTWEGRPHLLIADVGDNANQKPGEIKGKRPFVTLYVVEEPRLEGTRPSLNQRAPVVWRQEFVYEDGPRDCESVAVDMDQQRVLLISKRTSPPVLYELPLGPEHAKVRGVARRVAHVSGLPMPLDKDKLPDTRYGKFSFQNTAFDIASDGRNAVILTYGATWLFERRFDETWAEALARDPRLVATPPLRQAEALAFSPDGGTLYVTSEGIPAPLLRLDRERSIPIPQ